MASTNYVTKINKQPIAASQVAPNSPLESKLINMEATIAELEGVGAFQVAELTSGANPVPDVPDPSTKVIYLTKDAQSTEKDPYTEWIYTTDNEWEVIGTTSIDVTNYVQKVDGGTMGNFASLTADGSIADSNKSASDFATAAQGEKADTAYQLPSGGIPSSVMSSEVQASLGKADTAYQKDPNGIPAADLDSSVQASLGLADSAYQKPSGGIPATDINLNSVVAAIITVESIDDGSSDGGSNNE